ncbi:hypothetical protein [Ravibacter arvi]|uniref:hypothetical protein n=1 Tax=Ravibacter arvi TaxID=2051041 RepID=UPI0031EEB2A2
MPGAKTPELMRCPEPSNAMPELVEGGLCTPIPMASTGSAAGHFDKLSHQYS